MTIQEQKIVKLIEQNHENLKVISKSEIPAVKDLAIQMLSLSKFLVSSVMPDKMEHIEEYE